MNVQEQEYRQWLLIGGFAAASKKFATYAWGKLHPRDAPECLQPWLMAVFEGRSTDAQKKVGRIVGVPTDGGMKGVVDAVQQNVLIRDVHRQGMILAHATTLAVAVESVKWLEERLGKWCEEDAENGEREVGTEDRRDDRRDPAQADGGGVQTA